MTWKARLNSGTLDFFFFFSFESHTKTWHGERASTWPVPIFFVSYPKYHSTLSCTVYACGLPIQLYLLGARDTHRMVQFAFKRMSLDENLGLLDMEFWDLEDLDHDPKGGNVISGWIYHKELPRNYSIRKHFCMKNTVKLKSKNLSACDQKA